MEKFNLNTFNPNKHYVIEASAGTGKTYNIVQIVDKLVNQYNVDLCKILIVTYTEKAAGELKSRIREKVKNADIDHAPIYTIHSFCQNAIKEFGISANLPFNLGLIDDSSLYDFVERYIREGKILEDISLLMSVGFELNIDMLVNKLTSGIQKYYLTFNYEEDESIVSLLDIEKDKHLLKLIVDANRASSIEELFCDYPDIEKHFNVFAYSNNPKSNEFANHLKTNFEKEPLKEPFMFNGSKFKKSKKWPEEDELESFEFFKKLKEDISSFNAVNALTKIHLKDLYKSWQYEKEINKKQSFDDMIRYVRESVLNDDKLKNKLKEKYSRAIIDEFQDTNQRQFDIFKSIFLEDDEHKIIVVGDPKQSIYSFQGADINVYYDAVNTIVSKGGIMCMLNKNYRSSANMVDACNKLFSYYNFSGTTFNDSEYLSIQNGDSQEHTSLYENKEMNAIWLGMESIGETFKKVGCNDFAKIAVEQILDCCSFDENNKTKLQIKDKESKEYRNVSFKDFVVLARTSFEMLPIEKALKNAGIPYIRYKDNKLFSGRECVHWISLLDAINAVDFTGRNRKLFKKALFTNFFGFSLEEIDSEHFNRDDILEIEKINKWKQMAYDQKWEDLFDDIIINSNVVERMNSLKEIQSLAIIRQIGDYCIDYLSKGHSLSDLIRNLRRLSKGDSLDEEDQNGSLVSKSTNFDCVQIMTIHASKGLQFPVVIGVCGFKKPPTNFGCGIYHDEENGKPVLAFEKNKKITDEQIAEWKRLFYVAYTRAQFLLILPSYSEFGELFLEKSLSEFVDKHYDSINIVFKSIDSYDVLRKKSSAILAKSTKSNEDIETKDNQDLILKELIKDSKNKKTVMHSYSSLSHDSYKDENNDLEEVNKEGNMLEGLSYFDRNSKVKELEYDKEIEVRVLPIDYPRGAKMGTGLHEILEHTDFTNFENEVDYTIRRCFSNNGIKEKDEWISATKEIVYDVVNAKLPIIQGSCIKDETFKLNTISLENRKDETEFNFNVFGDALKDYCNGFVDLIFRQGDYYSILDWKSDSLNDDFESYASLQSLKKHVDDCYSIQRVLYSYCLIKWLHQFMPNMSLEDIYNHHFGGVYYVFLRGCHEDSSNGIYCQTWSSWKDLEDSFKEIVSKKIGGVVNV